METVLVSVDQEHPDQEVIRAAGEIIRRGGLVAFPTETVYGLGGDALNPESSRKIYAAKEMCIRDSLKAQEGIAQELGIPKENIFILHSGNVLELTEEKASVVGTVPCGAILVDGLGVGDVGNVVLRDRQHLAEDGIMIVVVALDGITGQIASGPDLVSRGFVYVKESDALMDEARDLMAVSYTHLDVYKRQPERRPIRGCV